VISLSLEISDMTGGAFDITVGPLVDLWGFGPPQRGARLPEPKRIEQTLAWVGYDKLELQSEPPAVRQTVDGLRIDLSAVAKGYAVDSLAELLKQHGIDNFLVEIGGELQLSGVRMDGTPWKIAIEKPVEEKREVETIIPLTGTALATSGNYRNFYVEQGQRYAHTIDPRQGRPIRHKLASATVLDPSCARADALATALMVLGETEGLRLIEDYRIAAYLIVYEKERLVDYASPAFTSRVERVSK
jgi:thiamine biosynthesis lipoprotein